MKSSALRLITYPLNSTITWRRAGRFAKGQWMEGLRAARAPLSQFDGTSRFLAQGKVASVNAAVERINELIRCLNELYPFDAPARQL